MKITPEHYKQLKAMIEPLGDKIKKHREFIIAEGKAKNIEARLAFDLMYAAPGALQFICDVLYKYMNDDHLATALKKIITEIEE